MRISRLVSLTTALFLAATSLHAQSARRVPGVWVTLSPAGALAGISCDDCADTKGRLGPSVTLAVGRTLSPRLALGLEVSGWWREVAGAVDHQGYLLAGATYFPGRTGTFLSGSIGLARFASEVRRGGDRTTSQAPALRIGVGYEVPFGREISLAPFANYFRSMAADLKVNGNSTGTRLSQHLLQIGVGLHWNLTGAISFPAVTR